MLAAKYNGPRIATLEQSAMQPTAIGLLTRVSALTGWRLPEDKAFVTALVNEFRLYLEQSCGKMTVEEVATAVREKPESVREWGKNLNIALIDECVQSYLQRRRDISSFEHRMSQRPVEARSLPVEVEWSSEWYGIKQMAKNGHFEDLKIVTPVYDWLLKTGKLTLTPQERTQIFTDCQHSWYGSLCLEILSGNADPSAREAHDKLFRAKGLDHKELLALYPDIHARIVNMAKCQAIKEAAMAALIDDENENI